jgi:Winged helix DNA-binding domain
VTAAPDFNDLVHAPNRLRICALLAAVGSAEFPTVREALGVADSVLSKHIAVLHDAGYVEVQKSTFASRVRTSLSLTPAGRAAYEGHIAALRAIMVGGSPVGLRGQRQRTKTAEPSLPSGQPSQRPRKEGASLGANPVGRSAAVGRCVTRPGPHFE